MNALSNLNNIFIEAFTLFNTDQQKYLLCFLHPFQNVGPCNFLHEISLRLVVLYKCKNVLYYILSPYNYINYILSVYILSILQVQATVIKLSFIVAGAYCVRYSKKCTTSTLHVWKLVYLIQHVYLFYKHVKN